jgi:sugar lactone lactonase YvrE
MPKKRTKKQKLSPITFIFSIGAFALLIFVLLFYSFCYNRVKTPLLYTKITTLAGLTDKLGEPYGIAVKNNETYFSDGEQGKIWKLSGSTLTVVTDKLSTPSAIAFDKNGDLIVADSGSHTIKKINHKAEITVVAGTENKSGFADGDAKKSLFNAPIGVAVADNKIFVADTYNDKIRVIENGKVSTLAGSDKGFFDNEKGDKAKFDTPCGLTVTRFGDVIVADTGNKRLRVIQKDGKTFTLAGNGETDLKDNFPLKASFVQPNAVAIDEFGVIYVTDGNSIRVIGRRIFPFVETINNPKRGFSDGKLLTAKVNRPSGIAFDSSGNLLFTDSDNQVVRVLTDGGKGSEVTPEVVAKMHYTAEEFRQIAPPRWSFNPPDGKREIAGTLGEIRGEMIEGKQTWFHNGLDIVGGFGETARFIRDEKVLRPFAAENFGGLRELLRMPTIGYIHLRLGRDKDNKPFDDNRFQFEKNGEKVTNVRIPRGTKFTAGDAIGTLNSMNHVHLIAGRSGAEMNALDALILPNVSDAITPTIEQISLFDINWQPIAETSPVKLKGKIRVVVRSYDQMDGNSSRRKLGVYKLGYQVFKQDSDPPKEPNPTISFATMPDEDAVSLVYAKGSKSGYTPETIFDYIVTNQVNATASREDFLDVGKLSAGNYTLRVYSADFFGNTATKDLNFMIE